MLALSSRGRSTRNRFWQREAGDCNYVADLAKCAEKRSAAELEYVNMYPYYVDRQRYPVSEAHCFLGILSVTKTVELGHFVGHFVNHDSNLRMK